MSNKSAISSQVISLPKGGGAQQGIGEKFSPDLFTGTGNFTIPIALPPGRNGFQPEINLVYSTGTGNGVFGLGWNLSIPGISRQTSKGIPRYDDNKDTFILSGAEDLVPVEKFETQTRYQPRTEGLFARIVHQTDSQNDYWQVKSKDGLISFYGTPISKADDPAVVSDPDNRDNVFAWNLSRTRDTFGNCIEYDYERDQAFDGPHRWDQLYLKRIRYADYDDENGRVQFLVSATFIYDERPDPFSVYRSGFEIRTRKRCTRIEIQTHPGKDTLVRTYHLHYLDQLQLINESLPLNGVSLLKQIKVVGHDGEHTEELPPLQFSYTQFEPAGRDFFPLEGYLPTRSLADPGLEQVDLFGNGLPDIIEMNGTVRYWRNLGNGTFDFPREMKEAPAGLDLASEGVQFIDADGDGRTDLMVTSGSLCGYYPLKFGGMWDKKSFQKYDKAPSFSLKDPEVRLIDLDGDGVTDAVRSGSRMECFFNDPKDGWNDTRFVERKSIEEFPNINFSDTRVKWADMSGDGLQDIVLVHDGAIEYWPNLGYGNWGRRITMRHCPRFPFGYDPKRILLGDVDGDGLADIVYVDDTKVTLWINKSGNAWSDPIEIKGTPPVTDMDAVRLADMLGTGISGVLWSSDAISLSRNNMYFLDLTGSIKPYVLCEMDNNMGVLTRVEYKPSTHYYLQDQKNPQTRWQTPLPFPVQVVARVEVIDAISKGKLTTEYSYHHGYWDGAEREFRGFGRVDQRDTEVFEKYHDSGLFPQTNFSAVDDKMYAPPLESRTWFFQGPVGDEFGDWHEPDYSVEFWNGDPTLLYRPNDMTEFIKSLPRRIKRDALRTLRGRILRTELYALDGSTLQDRPYTVTEYLHGVREESPPGVENSDRLHIFFSFAMAQRTTQWERGDDPMTQLSFTDDYDAFGQPRRQTAVALPRRSTKRHPVVGVLIGEIDPDETCLLATHTRTEYAMPDGEIFIHDRVSQVRSFELVDPPEIKETDPNNVNQVLKDQWTKALQVHLDFMVENCACRLIGHTLNYYDGDAFIGRSAGQVGPYGVLIHSEALVFTDNELDAAYSDRRPAYLNGTAALPPGTPPDFNSDLGYRLGEDLGKDHVADGYYVDTRRQQYDVQQQGAKSKRGLVLAIQDALKNQATVQPDKYWLLPDKVIDPVGLQTTAEYDYRVLQPIRVTDPNGNVTHFCFTPLGLLGKQYLQGKNGEGGSIEKPDVELLYDFNAFLNTRDQPDPQPIYVHTKRRLYHAHDTSPLIPPDKKDDLIESREYSDGFGRLLQTRTQADDVIFGEHGENVGLPGQYEKQLSSAIGTKVEQSVVISGWQVYNNKGEVVEKYEPFFDADWDFQPEIESKKGVHATLFYDPRGQVVRTVNPDGSEQRVIFGIPSRIDDPDHFIPTPWESYSYDPNDNAERTHTHELNNIAHHYNTPANVLVDALGRTIMSVQRNRNKKNGVWSDIELYLTRSKYDIRGNVVEIYDTHGRCAFKHAYDLLNNPLRIDSIDAGIRTSVLDANGNLIEYRDSKGSLVLRLYDQLNRPTKLWACNDAENPLTLREYLIYGDALENQTPEHNLLGQLYRHYDEAGLLTFASYDFKGNLLEKSRRVISDTAIARGWTADWGKPESAQDIDEFEYCTSTVYDALNRPLQITYPEDVEKNRSKLIPTYNRAGALKSVKLNDDVYVHHIAYNAKGQRLLFAYGNGTMTRYAYDANTFRLSRLRSERFTHTESLTWSGTGAPLQDFTYQYDLAGNITAIEERTPNCGVTNSQYGKDRLVRQFDYDPIYRLISAGGRACKEFSKKSIIPDDQLCGFVKSGAVNSNRDNAPDLTENYTQTYDYDPSGNMLKLRYQGDNGHWNRLFGLDDLSNDQWQNAKNNRLTGMTVNGDIHHFQYDANGNMTKQNSERRYSWDHADRMIGFRIQPENSDQSSVEAVYLYGSDGIRVKRWVRNNESGDGESTVYIDGIFEYYKNIDTDLSNNHVHVVDDKQWIVIKRVGAALKDDIGPSVQFQLTDHLGSCHFVIDLAGNWNNVEEYFPFGETSFGSFLKKRYRFSGKERDEESGLIYFGTRYYGANLGRWMQNDPTGIKDGLNLYQYVHCNPIVFIDPNGTETVASDYSEKSDDAFNTVVDWQTNNLEIIGKDITKTVQLLVSIGLVFKDLKARLSAIESLGIDADTALGLNLRISMVAQQLKDPRNKRSALECFFALNKVGQGQGIVTQRENIPIENIQEAILRRAKDIQDWKRSVNSSVTESTRVEANEPYSKAMQKLVQREMDSGLGQTISSVVNNFSIDTLGNLLGSSSTKTGALNAGSTLLGLMSAHSAWQRQSTMSLMPGVSISESTYFYENYMQAQGAAIVSFILFGLNIPFVDSGIAIFSQITGPSQRDVSGPQLAELIYYVAEKL